MKDMSLNKEKIKFVNKDLIIHEKNKLVLMYSKESKKHIFQSKEVYDYIIDAIEENLTYKEFIELFSDNDKRYVEHLINNMIKAGILYRNEGSNEIKKVIRELDDVHLVTTNRCNLTCSHCCTSCSPNKQDKLTTEELLSIIDFIMTLNPKEMVLTGGEPLIRKDFKTIVEYIKYNFKNINLVLSTNGTLIDDNNIDFIVDNFHRIEISIDGVDEETCSKVRGKGVFGKIISNIHKLRDKKFYNIRTSMVFGDRNEHLIEKFEKLNLDLGTEALRRVFIAEGRGKGNVLEFLSEEDSIIPELSTRVDSNIGRDDKKSCSCDIYKNSIFIDHDGKIYPCPSLMKDKYSLGNILLDETKDKLLNFEFGNCEVKQNMQNIYLYNHEKCKNCDLNLFCMTCPAVVDVLIDNEKEFNKWCGRMKPQLNRIIWGEEC